MKVTVTKPTLKIRPPIKSLGGNIGGQVFFVAAAAFLCGTLLTGGRPTATAAPSGEPATLLLLHGEIYTGDAAHPRAEAVAIRGEQIIAVGSNAEMQKLQ